MFLSVYKQAFYSMFQWPKLLHTKRNLKLKCEGAWVKAKLFFHLIGIKLIKFIWEKKSPTMLNFNFKSFFLYTFQWKAMKSFIVEKIRLRGRFSSSVKKGELK